MCFALQNPVQFSSAQICPVPFILLVSILNYTDSCGIVHHKDIEVLLRNNIIIGISRILVSGSCDEN